MGNCKRTKILFKLLPFKSWQYYLLQRHLLKCPDCLGDLAGVEEARSATISQDKIRDVKDFWPQFSASFKKEERKKKILSRPAWRWAVGTAGLVALTVAAVFILTLSHKTEYSDLAVKLRINYIKIYEEPAQAIIFQTQDPNRTFVWVEKQSEGEMQ
jgi:hypothetical protein